MDTRPVKLTELERRLLLRSARFVLAGEWPWDEETFPKNETPEALERAAEKLEATL